MLTFESREKDGHLILSCIDEEIQVDGKPYSDWTAVSSIYKTHALVEVHLEAAARRLKNRYDRFLKSLGYTAPKDLGRVVVGHVIDVHDTLAAQRPLILHLMRRHGLV